MQVFEVGYYYFEVAAAEAVVDVRLLESYAVVDVVADFAAESWPPPSLIVVVPTWPAAAVAAGGEAAADFQPSAEAALTADLAAQLPDYYYYWCYFLR